VRIKEGDEWKEVSIMHISSFEPTVIFFGMTNSLATFQAMINKILRDLINKGKVAAFVDNMLVGTETGEGYNKIIEEILKRLEENNLYVKLVRLANSKARIKLTAPLSVFDKENSIEFPLDFLHYLYNYYMVCAFLSHAYHVTYHVTSCDVML